MARIARKFVYDKQQGQLVEVTAEPVKAVCDEIHETAQKIRKHLERKQALEQRERRHWKAKYPIMPEAMAVCPEDIPRAQEIARKNGFHTDYTSTGEPIITSAEHYRKHRKAFGFYMRNSYDSPVNR